MDNWMFWLLVFPVLLVAILYYLGFLTAGLSFIGATFKRGAPKRNLLVLFIGLLIAAAPFIASKIQRIQAERQADLWQAEIANFERVNLRGRMPKKIVIMNSAREARLLPIAAKYGLRPFDDAEAGRLRSAYRQYRRNAYCHSHSSGKMMSDKIQIPVCKPLPESLQNVLNLREPVLFFAEDSATSYRRTNILMGDKYELRLVTPRQDLLVDYFEQRTLKKPIGITNPFGSGWILDHTHKPPRDEVFLESALRGEPLRGEAAK